MTFSPFLVIDREGCLSLKPISRKWSLRRLSPSSLRPLVWIWCDWPRLGERWIVEPVALLRLLPLPAQCLLLRAEACAEALPPQCKTGTCRGRGREVAGRQGALVSEPRGKRMRRRDYEGLGKRSPGYAGAGAGSQEAQRRREGAG